jgi:hypothetical protein
VRGAWLRSIGVLAFFSGVGPSIGEGEPTRRIAPELIPEYRTTGQHAGPPFTVMAPTSEAPLGSCVRTMQRVVWLRCLRDTADLSLQLVEQATEQAAAWINAREDAPPPRKRHWLRGFEEAHDTWSKLREQECQTVASAEPNAPKDIYEARLLCLLRENERRRGELESRFLLKRPSD